MPTGSLGSVGFGMGGMGIYVRGNRMGIGTVTKLEMGMEENEN